MTEDPGVKMNEPPPEISTSISTMVEDHLRGTSHTGAVLGVATTKGFNVVVAKKKDDRFVIETWIGKSWGSPLEAGIKGIVYF